MGTTLTPFNQGQLAQLGNNLNIAVATALPKVAAKFEPKPLLKALDGRGQFLADRLGEALENILSGMFVLGMPGTATIALSGYHDPDSFFRTGPGLYVWDDFRSRIVAQAKPTVAGTAFELNNALLTKNMSDEEIEKALPKGHLFDESALCAIIASMISEQPNGKEGKLLNNGYANLFYTSSCVVGVDWHADYRKWSVFTWERDGNGWGAGVQVFSPATAT